VDATAWAAWLALGLSIFTASQRSIQYLRDRRARLIPELRVAIIEMREAAREVDKKWSSFAYARRHKTPPMFPTADDFPSDYRPKFAPQRSDLLHLTNWGLREEVLRLELSRWWALQDEIHHVARLVADRSMANVRDVRNRLLAVGIIRPSRQARHLRSEIDAALEEMFGFLETVEKEDSDFGRSFQALEAKLNQLLSSLPRLE
jgi:hypothetical protein